MSATLVLAGGGTGGHVYPLIAVADALRALDPDLRLVFVGTSRGMETRVVPARGYELELCNVQPIRGAGVAGALRGALRAAASLPEARALVRRLEPRAVLSIGGYAAGPVTLAARAAGVPLALIEPNAVAGLANRLVAPLVRRAYTAFPEPEAHFPRGTVLQAGVPIRDGFEPRASRFPGSPLCVLVLGGSQGARTLNDAVPRALARCKALVRVTHQCGAAHASEVSDLYASLGAAQRASVVPFIDDVPAALADADLVIARSGASSVSEICAIGRPSLLVPYPFAAGDHQTANARSLEAEGAARCISNAEATPERLALEIDRLAFEGAALAQMTDAARRLAKPHAARDIALDFLTLAGLVPRAPIGRAPSSSVQEAT